MRGSLVGFVGLCGAALIVACTQPRRAPPASTDFEEDGFKEHVRVLASDEFAGRRPGTAGEEKTVAYIAAQFRRMKLKPVSGESYLQSVPMVEISPTAAPMFELSGRGPTRRLIAGKDMVVWTRRPEAAVELRGSEMVFVGYGIVAPEYAWDDYAGAEVRGKTVVMLVGDPGQSAANPPVFKGRTLTFYGHWSYKLEEAARHGAAAVLLVHDGKASGYTWDEVVDRWAGPQAERAPTGAAAIDAAVQGWISGEAAGAIFARAGLDFAAAAGAAARPGFKSMALGLRADILLGNSIRRFNSANVIAYLPGARHGKEYVLYVAHWDHLGTMAPPAEGTYHGAVSNASGVAGLLLLAQSFSRTRPAPDRSIVFVALTGGESRLAGSDYYAENPAFPLQDTVAAINLDTLRIGGPTRDVMIFGFGQSDLDGYVREAAALQGREVHVDPNPERGEYFRSDAVSFAKNGVPAMYAVGGLDDAARGPDWGRAQLEDYYAHRYRRPSDEYSSDWDVRGALQDLDLYYRVGLRLTQARRFPNWSRGSEFRNLRERDRGAVGGS